LGFRDNQSRQAGIGGRPAPHGEGAPAKRALPSLTELLNATGVLPLGLEASQLMAIVRWAKHEWKPSETQLEAAGLRSQVIGLVSLALEPGFFSKVVTYGGMKTMAYLLEKPVTYLSSGDVLPRLVSRF